MKVVGLNGRILFLVVDATHPLIKSLVKEENMRDERIKKSIGKFM